MDQEIHGLIPARYASSRFPGKPLLLLQGKPMFWHVWSRVKASPLLRSVSLATDDELIAKAAQELGVPYVMTSKNHQSGTDRVFEAAEHLSLSDTAIIVNIQGDEPAIRVESIHTLLQAFEDTSVQVATLAHPLQEKDLENPHKVKLVCAQNGDALYFSRAAIPYFRHASELPIYGHVGLYAYTMSALRFFVQCKPTPLERAESLEQLRFLEHSIPIRVMHTDEESRGIDTKEDIAAVLALMNN